MYFIFQFYNSIFLYFIVCKKKFFEKLGSSTFPDKKKLIRPEIPQYVFLHWLCEIVSIPLLHKLVPLLHKLATFSHWFLFPVLIYNSDHIYYVVLFHFLYISIIFTSCEEIFKELAQVAHLLSRKKKRIVAAAKNSNFSFLSLWKCNCKSLSYFPFQVHIFFNWQPCRQMIFCNVRVLSLIRKKIHIFRQA